MRPEYEFSQGVRGKHYQAYRAGTNVVFLGLTKAVSHPGIVDASEHEETNMSVEANKALYRRWFEEVVTRGNLALADELLSHDYVLHFPGMSGPVDRAGHKQLVVMFRTAFPDWVETVDDVIAEGDKVVIRVTGSGTHKADFQGVPATGRGVKATGVGIGRIAGGRIAEAWGFYDAMGMMQQLGDQNP